LGKSLVLINPNYEKDFLIFSFASTHTIVVVLLQKNEKHQEHPISFFSKAQRDIELKYSTMEKHDYALVKALKYFRDYILHSKIFPYVPTSVIKDILTQTSSEGKRGKWIAKIHEYDVEIKPTKLVKGQGLAKLLAKSNCKVLDFNALSKNITATKSEEDETEETSLDVSAKFSQSDWYKDIIFYFQNFSCSPSWDKSRARSIKLKDIKNFILGENMFWKDLWGILLNCLTKEETEGIIFEFHKYVCGGHHAWRATAYTILRVGYLFSDANRLVRACIECQMFA
jgi:hypothetical protein